MAGFQTLSDALAWQLEGLAGAVQQLDDRLPRLSDRAEHEPLSHCLRQHHARLRDQTALLDDCFRLMSREPGTRPAPATVAMLEEADAASARAEAAPVRDALLSATLREVFQIQIAGVTASCEWAEHLGRQETALLLQQVLADNKRTQHCLVQAAHQIEAHMPPAA
jgi:ferritin-like metal-binding protein YciE